jgi:DeoR/GlpR family transcriptional regulator of sugar metabolism
LQVERHKDIINLLRVQNVVKIEDLVRTLGVSENTVRRDLGALEQEGLLRRTQGGALLPAGTPYFTPFTERQQRNTTEKRLIAHEAARLISPGSTIILDAGTTTIELAHAVKGIPELTVVTTSIEVANCLLNAPQVSVLLSGGILFPISRSLVGLPAEQFFDGINADLLFLSVRGISFEKGFTNQNIQETAVKQRMIKAAREVVVLADSSKFNKVTLSAVCGLDDVDVIITDRGAPTALVEQLRERGIKIITVDVPA